MNTTIQLASAADRIEDRINRRSIRTHFVPRWDANPYQSELARGLKETGVTVLNGSSLKDIVARAKESGEMLDLVHVHALPAFDLRLTHLARWFLFFRRLHRLQQRGVKIVWTVHNSEHHEARFPRVDRNLARLVYRRADGVIVHSESARTTVEAAWNVEARRNTAVVHHGNYIEAYSNAADARASRGELGLPQDKLIVLFLGHLRPYKGIVPLVHVFEQIASPAMHLVIAGEPLSDTVRNQIDSAISGAASITFRPSYVAPADVAKYMAAADVAVFPYTKALTSGALVLAMSFGKACIAPRIGAITDTLGAEGGFLYDANDAEGLRTALQLASKKRSQLAAMGAHNRARAEGWTWNSAAKLTRAVYDRCWDTH